MKNPTKLAAELLGWHAWANGKTVTIFGGVGVKLREQRTFDHATTHDEDRILEETIREKLGSQGARLLELCGEAITAAAETKILRSKP